MAKIEIFQFCIEYFPTTLRVKNFVQIALSLTVSEIFRFFRFSQKFKDGRQKWRKLKFLNFIQNTFLLPCESKNSVQIALSLTVCEILRFFRFSQKFKDGRQKWRKLKFLNFVQNTFLLPCESKNSVQIALSLTVCEILRFFRFSQKFKMAAKSAEN